GYSKAGRRWLVEARESLENHIDSLKSGFNSADQKALADAKIQASYSFNIDFYSKFAGIDGSARFKIDFQSGLPTQKIARSLEGLKKNIDSTRQAHAAENILSTDLAQGNATNTR